MIASVQRYPSHRASHRRRAATAQRPDVPRAFREPAAVDSGKVIRHPAMQGAAAIAQPNTPAPLTLVPPATPSTAPQAPAKPSRRARQTTTPKVPLWLRTLLIIQQGSSILTFCLATAVLMVYGSTVYIQQAWSEDFRHLEQLQREKRELTTANELMKNQLAQQATAPENNLVAPSPANTIFLPKATGQPAQPVSTPTAPLVSFTADAPLGY
ncbi:hypothetical protein [Spirulina major]|uniref:hypothetical protein n=1 Tax=Spirulina major TaxID=270636 RepID=UPI0009FC2B65|nr:hypothetical protein [Spirulina major]